MKYYFFQFVYEVPRESCQLIPRKSCTLVPKFLPKLEPVEQCYLVPFEVCRKEFVNPRKIRIPVVKKVCDK